MESAEDSENRSDPITPQPALPPSLPPTNLYRLFFSPSSFFTQSRLEMSPHYLLAAWLIGITGVVDRIDRKMIKSDFGREDLSLKLVTESWGGFWATAIIFGLIGAPIIWLIGGWWYRKRLNWSGEDSADPFLARLVFTYSSLVVAIPSLLLVIIATPLFANYYDYWNSDELWSVSLIIFPFWSILVSYRGVVSRFNVQSGKAQLWFAWLPAMLYLFGVGAVAFFYSKFADI